VIAADFFDVAESFLLRLAVFVIFVVALVRWVWHEAGRH